MLALSTRGRYAVRIMVYLAARRDKRPAPKKEISLAEGMSQDYVEQILLKLRAAGLVLSRRGAGGGFRLAQDPSQVTVADVVTAAEGPIELVPCGDGCQRVSQCVVQRVWRGANEALYSALAGTTVGELAEEARGMTEAPAFQI